MFWDLVTVYKSNTRLKAVKKKKKKPGFWARRNLLLVTTPELPGIPGFRASHCDLDLLGKIPGRTRPWTQKCLVQLRTGGLGVVVWLRETGGQAAIQGCEMTVVLPSFHSMRCPPLGGV